MIKSKKNNYKFWHSPVALIAFFCILMFFGYRVIDLIHTERETNYKKNLILDQIEGLKKKEEVLTLNISKLETDEGKEEIIREKYQVAKRGEKMLIIVDDDSKNDTSLDKEGKTEHGFFEWFKSVFKK